MEMTAACIVYRAGLVSQELFSTLLIVGIVTTVITPSMLKYWLKDEKKMKAMLSAGETAGLLVVRQQGVGIPGSRRLARREQSLLGGGNVVERLPGKFDGGVASHAQNLSCV